MSAYENRTGKIDKGRYRKVCTGMRCAWFAVFFLSCIVRKCRWKGNAKNFLVCKEETNVPVMRDKQVIVNGRVPRGNGTGRYSC